MAELVRGRDCQTEKLWRAACSRTECGRWVSEVAFSYQEANAAREGHLDDHRNGRFGTPAWAVTSPAGELNPALRAEITGLQQAMTAAAERTGLPARFTAEPHGNKVTITDSRTGRAVTVGLCDYGGARAVLAALFGGDSNDE